ncbi:MAG: NgoFVII family restriction endonuclease [Candidatus Methanoplasma sp.]|nr:NgoFVII family restriction endonuclease [Candidatus Methanoplasma sp.]
MFSESDCPYLAPRLAENIFCECLGADNLSRSDCAIDAKLNKVGIGVKTFVEDSGGTSFQKIAEFNKDSPLLRSLSDEELVAEASKLRNARLEFAMRAYGVEALIYHCIVRGRGSVRILESKMDFIDVGNIRLRRTPGKTTASFTDGKNEYKFHRSKSTLYMRFASKPHLNEIGVAIIDEPFAVLAEMSGKMPGLEMACFRPSVHLPLFSAKKGGGRCVPEKSGLNHWNASGRKRNMDEAYIRVPAKTLRENSGFFPQRGVSFKLRLPDGGVLSAKICQEGDKALMSDPNSALGRWLLRDVLKLEPGSLATYGLLDGLGIDHAVVTKNGPNDFSIDFTHFEEDVIDIEGGTGGRSRIRQTRLDLRGEE